MAKLSESEDWEQRKEQIVGLGERSFRKSYYPQLRENLDRLERFRVLLDRATDIVVMLSVPDGIVVDANGALGQLLGCPADTLIGRPLASLGLGEAGQILDVLDHDAGSVRAGNPAGSHSMLTEFRRDGQSLWLELTLCTTVLDGSCYSILVARDVSERKRAHELVTALLAEKDALLENALVGIALINERRIVSCNRRFEEIFGYAHEALIGESSRVLYADDDSFAALGDDAYRELSTPGQHFTATMQMRRRDGELVWCELSGRALDSADGRRGSIWVITDITERKSAEEKARYLSYHDVLTRLPNQLLFQDRIQQAIAFSNRAGTKVALMLVDLDRFKAINDVLGHETGDQLLIEVARRLESNLRSTDTVSRQGGDEFLLLLTNVSEPDAIATFTSDLMEHLAEPFPIGDQELTISVSIGVAIYPEDGADFGTLLKKADMAMYRAKDAGRNTYRFFNEEMNDDAVAQLTLSAGLRRALDAGQFALYYQPQIAIDSGRLLGAEALIRWKHPDLGLVSPGRFIPVAEETGLIVDIGDWVIREAARWHRTGWHDLTVAVNLSALQFKRGNIEATVTRALAESGVDPSTLELELTESILIRDTENVLTAVKRLKSMGIKLSIDDFGTGYSSLSYLKRFEVDKLKIDQSFVRDLETDAEDAAIVRAIIEMAHSLGLRTVAEGVESPGVLELLRRDKCDEAQGYYFARPMPAAGFADFIARWGKPADRDTQR